jgi:hypothetical protein
MPFVKDNFFQTVVDEGHNNWSAELLLTLRLHTGRSRLSACWVGTSRSAYTVKCEHSEKQLSIGGMAVVISCPNCSLATSVVANHLLVSRVDIPCFLVIFLLHQLFGHLSKYPFCSVQELSYPMTSVWIEISQVYPSKGFM